MRQFTFILFSVLLISTCFGQSYNKIKADNSITTLDKIDIEEINITREILINEIIKDGFKTNVSITKFLQKDYQDAKENAHNADRNASKYYPKKITKASFLTYYIDKAIATRCKDHKKDRLLLNCTEQRQYEFLIVFPYIDGTNHGYNTESTQFLIHFEKISKWTDDEKENKRKTSVSTNYLFSDPVQLNLFMAISVWCMNRKDEKKILLTFAYQNSG